jgi:DNA primase
VDVIAMVTAGYAATVAPLGTALTTDQLGHLWKMANEPILCFDGDAAGRRAAYRAIDLALPLIKPGKSLLFATLPDGHDPDDLVRSGGPGAIADVLAGARPLAEVLWGRETQGTRIDTPERRAGLEARINELANAIGDEAVRRYYRQDLRERMRNLVAPAVAPGRSVPGRFTPDRRRPPTGRAGWGRGARPGAGFAPEALGPASARLQASSIVRGSRTALPPREALILLAACNHPWLIEHHAEELADLEFLNGDADLLRRSMLDAVASLTEITAAALREALLGRDCGPVLARIEKAVTHFADWPAWEGAAAEDIRQWWNHVLTLHRKNRTLNRELKEAERALGDEPSEENFARLQDVRVRLEAIDGTEASIEGFGASSGRASRGL